MIRDEFNKTENSNGKKSIRSEYAKQNKEKISLREAEGIKTLGARAYYSSRVPKLRDGIKVYIFSAWFVLIMGVLTGVMTALGYFFPKTENIDAEFWVYSALTLVMIIYSVLCWTVFIPVAKRNIERYTEKIKEINEETSAKQKAVYDFMLKNNKGE
jgi:hypothetical protein